MQKRKPMKSDRETNCKNTSNGLKNCQKTRSYPNYSPKQVWHKSKLILLCSSVTKRKRKSIVMSRIYELRDQKGTRIQGWIQSNVRFDPVSDMKVFNQYGRYSIEVQVQSLFQDQTVSWIRIVNGIDKFARSHADPRGREGFGDTRCKSETNIKTVINKWLGLYSYWTETMDWHWNTGIQWSLLFSSAIIHH